MFVALISVFQTDFSLFNFWVFDERLLLGHDVAEKKLNLIHCESRTRLNEEFRDETKTRYVWPVSFWTQSYKIWKTVKLQRRNNDFSVIVLKVYWNANYFDVVHMCKLSTVKSQIFFKFCTIVLL